MSGEQRCDDRDVDPRLVKFHDLLQAARQGDRNALGKLLCGAQTYLEALCSAQWRGLAGPQRDVADLVQQTLMDGHRDFSQFRGDTAREFACWIEAILHHNAGDCARRDSRRSQNARPVASIDATDQAVGEQFADDETPSWKVMLDERDRQLESAVAELPPAQQQLVGWRCREGLSFAQIAEQLGVTSQTARKMWSRAIAKLRERLERKGVRGTNPR